MWEEGCVVEGNNIVVVVEGKLVGTVCMGRKMQRERCRARCGTQLGLSSAVPVPYCTATTSQPHGRESQGEVKNLKKKKAIIHQARAGRFADRQTGLNGNRTGLVRQERKKESEIEAPVNG